MAKRSGKPKPKSIKSKAINKNSKRKLDTLGKKMKKGYAGEAIMYMTRSQALRKLSLSLKDFRRICILKGIYPRDPKHKPNKSQTYYHAKDIAYISHEPIIDYFRKMKTFLKKLSRSHGRGENSEVLRKWESKPEMNLDHLVKERYPTFNSALSDMDDALSTIHLFALLPASTSIQASKAQQCRRLCHEWNFYVIQSRSLRKVFISIKGIYYQAEVQGEKITWLVPHKFSQDLPSDVDFNVMLTFLDFYHVFLRFVLYRLYLTAGMKYPPTVDSLRDCEGAEIDALTAELNEKPAEATEESRELEEKSAKNVAAMTISLQNLPVPAGDAYELEEAFADSEEARELLRKQRETKQRTCLLEGKVFFLAREVPRGMLEFVIRSFGGKVGWEGPGSPISPADPSITHVIVDRPAPSPALCVSRGDREFVQPQWVADCVNQGVLLPAERYAPGKTLPPHLSPFVDNVAEGYTPEYQKEIDAMKRTARGEDEAEKQGNGETGETEKPTETDVGKFAREIENEENGGKEEEEGGEKEETKTKMSTESTESTTKTKTKTKAKSKKEEEEEEEKERRLTMAKKKHQRLFREMERKEKKKERTIETLKSKAEKAKNRKGGM